MGPRNAALGGGYACGLCHWGFRWSSLRGKETCEGCAETGDGDDDAGGTEEGRRKEGTRGPALQNEDPTPQDGWEQTHTSD
eukprot:1094203-Pyramimonas_sp.AAC.1